MMFKKGINDLIVGKLAVKDSLLNVRLNEQINNNQIVVAQQQELLMFTNLKNQKGVGFLLSGIAYMVDSTGSGERPTSKDSIEIEVRGFLADGQLFTDTYQNKQPLKIKVSNLIPGLAEGVQLMTVGSKWRIFVPASLAYGSKGISGLIPPYTALVFQIELKNILKK